jgi:glutamine synthetase type III
MVATVANTEVVEIYKKVDMKKDGFIKKHELLYVLQKLDGSLWTESRVRQLLEVSDLDKNENIDLEEFLTWVFTDTGSSPQSSPCVQDELDLASSAIFDDKTMKATLPHPVYVRFKDNLITGKETSEEDMQAIAEAMFTWARAKGALSFAHWFFPMRGGGGATGGVCGAFKMDTLIDLEWSSQEPTKPFKTTLPYERLFFGETDGSSFPNGGLRATHIAAAFTTWDRSSPCFVMDKVLRVPCSFVTHLGACIDDKTPLLRSNDAVNKEGLRLLKAIKIGMDANSINSYLGWEQEFFCHLSATLSQKARFGKLWSNIDRLPPDT